MNAKLSLILAATLTVLTGQVQAADVGRWLCPDCALYPEDYTTGKAVEPAGEVLTFIKNVVNLQQFPQTPNTPPKSGWGPLDTVTICNGSKCITLTFRYGIFVPVTGLYRDSGKGYRNATFKQSSGPVGGSFSIYSVNYRYINTTTYEVVFWEITTGPLTPPQLLPDGRTIGGVSTFTTGFDWGGYTDSNAAGGSAYGGGSGGGVDPVDGPPVYEIEP